MVAAILVNAAAEQPVRICPLRSVIIWGEEELGFIRVPQFSRLVVNHRRGDLETESCFEILGNQIISLRAPRRAGLILAFLFSVLLGPSGHLPHGVAAAIH